MIIGNKTYASITKGLTKMMTGLQDLAAAKKAEIDDLEQRRVIAVEEVSKAERTASKLAEILN